MKKKLKNILWIFLIVIMLSVPIIVHATPIDEIKPQRPDDELVSSANTWRSKILYVVQLIGSAIAVGVLTVLGVKYMMAAPEGKAEIKKQAIVYIIGAVLLFGAVGIAGIIRNIGTTLEATSTAVIQNKSEVA